MSAPSRARKPPHHGWCAPVPTLAPARSAIAPIRSGKVRSISRRSRWSRGTEQPRSRACSGTGDPVQSTPMSLRCGRGTVIARGEGRRSVSKGGRGARRADISGRNGAQPGDRRAIGPLGRCHREHIYSMTAGPSPPGTTRPAQHVHARRESRRRRSLTLLVIEAQRRGIPRSGRTGRVRAPEACGGRSALAVDAGGVDAVPARGISILEGIVLTPEFGATLGTLRNGQGGVAVPFTPERQPQEPLMHAGAGAGSRDCCPSRKTKGVSVPRTAPHRVGGRYARVGHHHSQVRRR